MSWLSLLPGLFFAVLIGRVRLRKGRPDPAAAGRPVPQAVIAALRQGEGRDNGPVLNAAVFELADAGVLRIEPADAQRPALVAPNVLPPASELPRYQSVVVGRLLHLTSSHERPVPLTALHSGEDHAAHKWYRVFLHQVRREAIRYGLLQRPVGQSVRVLLVVLGVASEFGFVVAFSSLWSGARVLVPVAGVLLLMLIVTGYRWAVRSRLSAAGRSALASASMPTRAQVYSPQSSAPSQPQLQPQFLGQDGASGQTAVLPALTPDGVKVLPHQLQPLPAHMVWSDFGGSWHPLDTRTRETYQSGFSTGPAVLGFSALCCEVVMLATLISGRPASRISEALFGVLPVFILAAVGVTAFSRRRLPKRAVLHGQIVKLWTEKTDSGQGSSTRYFCSLDVGLAPESVRLRVGQGMFRQLAVGDHVEVEVNPRRRRLRSLRPVEAEF